MVSQKKPKMQKQPDRLPTLPQSIKEPPPIKHFAAPSESFVQGITVDDLRRSSITTSWSVNEKLNGSEPPPRYPLGGSSEGLSVADANRRIDWVQLFSIPPRNPHLLKRAIELELLPTECIELLPASEESSHSKLEYSTEQSPTGNQRKATKISSPDEKTKRGEKQ